MKGKGRVREKGRVNTREREVLYLLVHSVNTYKSQGRARLKPGARHSVQFSHLADREPRAGSKSLAASQGVHEEDAETGRGARTVSKTLQCGKCMS